MGGYNSGRHRERNRGAVNSAIRLNIRALRRQGFLRPGEVTSGLWGWTRTATGEETASVSFTVDLTADSGTLLLRFILNGEPTTQEIEIVGSPMRYGGQRYYFRCPSQGRQCEILPMIDGVFASRQAHRLTFQSQSSTEIDRMQARARMLKERLWPENGSRRPRGKNRERLLDAWEKAETAFEDIFVATVMRRWGSAL